jgi:hypothetical protein
LRAEVNLTEGRNCISLTAVEGVGRSVEEHPPSPLRHAHMRKLNADLPPALHHISGTRIAVGFLVA